MTISTLTGTEKGPIVRAKINEVITEVNATSIVGITGTIAQFNTACTDADFATGGGTATGTNTGDNATNSNYTTLATTLATANSWSAVQTFTSPLITNGAINFNAPEGFMVNGKIVPTVASGNLTLTLTGTSASLSSTNPCYVMIGGVTRTITANVVTSFLNAGTNWGNAGSTELATKEVDWFCYILDYNNAGTAFNLGISRYPLYTNLSEVTGGYTSEKYLMQAGNTGIENVVNIGRFAATLSAGAGYTWSIPTYTASNLIQRPIYETRWLSANLVAKGLSGSAGAYAQDNVVAEYKIVGDNCFIKHFGRITNLGSWSGELNTTFPFTAIPTSWQQNFGRLQAQGGITTKAIVNAVANGTGWTNNYAVGGFAYSNITTNDWYAIEGVYKI